MLTVPGGVRLQSDNKADMRARASNISLPDSGSRMAYEIPLSISNTV